VNDRKVAGDTPTAGYEGRGKLGNWLHSLRGPDRVEATGWISVISATDPDLTPRHIDTGHGRGAITVAHRAIWVANATARTVVRIDPRTLDLTAVQRFRKMPIAIAAGPSAVWALGLNGWLWRIWPDGRGAEGIARLGRHAIALAYAGGLVWALRRNGELVAVEPAGGEGTRRGKVPRPASGMASDGDRLWIIGRRGREVLSVDATTGKVDGEAPLPHRARRVAAADGKLLVGLARASSRRHGCLGLVDSEAGQVTAMIDLPGRPRAIAADGDRAWVACGVGRAREGTIERVDLRSGAVLTWRATDWPVSDIAITQGALVAAMGISSLPAEASLVGHGMYTGGDFGSWGGHGGGATN
jgi:hypothetical protein